MDRQIALLATVAIGGLLALQAPINSGLGRNIGGVQAALVSFLVGTAALTVIASLANGGLGALGDFALPWYYLTGGLMGAVYVTVVLFTVRTIGAGGIAAATVTGQLAASMVVDRLGMFGLTAHPITATRMLGVGLLVTGTLLVIPR